MTLILTTNELEGQLRHVANPPYIFIIEFREFEGGFSAGVQNTNSKARLHIMLAACRRAETQNAIRFNGDRGFSIFVSRKRRYDHAAATANRRDEWNDPALELPERIRRWSEFVAAARQALPASHTRSFHATGRH